MNCRCQLLIRGVQSGGCSLEEGVGVWESLSLIILMYLIAKYYLFDRVRKTYEWGAIFQAIESNRLSSFSLLEGEEIKGLYLILMNLFIIPAFANQQQKQLQKLPYQLITYQFYNYPILILFLYAFPCAFRINCCQFALNNLQLIQCNKKNTEMLETSNYLKSILENCESLHSQTLSEAMRINNKKSSDIRKEYYASRLQTPLSHKIQHLNSTLKSLSSSSFKANQNHSKNNDSSAKILLPFKSRNHKKAKELIKLLSSSRRNIRQAKSKQKIASHQLFQDESAPFAMITEISQTFDSKRKHNHSSISHKHDRLYRNLTESSEMTQQMIRKITDRPKLMRPETSNHHSKVNFRQVLKNNNVFKKMAYYNETYKQYEKKRSCIRPYIPPSNITALAYTIYERTDKFGDCWFVASLKCKISREIASLTKIMTAIVVLDTLGLCNIDKYAEEIMISKPVTKINGTTAHLEPGQIYTIQQLLFGMMLPSGNDASLALALWAGEKLFHFQKKAKKTSGKATHRTKTTISQQSTMTTEFPTWQNYYDKFIEQMNAKAQSLKMLKTKFSNPHGLADPNNKSCCYDLTILCDFAMKNDFFRSLVSTQEYRCRILNTSLQAFKEVCWKNTHELLLANPMEYLGVKTGFTCNAGACLVSCINIEGKEFIFVVLGSSSQQTRFRDTEILKNWLVRQQKRAVEHKKDAAIRQFFHSKGES